MHAAQASRLKSQRTRCTNLRRATGRFQRGALASRAGCQANLQHEALSSVPDEGLGPCRKEKKCKEKKCKEKRCKEKKKCKGGADAASSRAKCDDSQYILDMGIMHNYAAAGCQVARPFFFETRPCINSCGIPRRWIVTQSTRTGLPGARGRTRSWHCFACKKCD